MPSGEHGYGHGNGHPIIVSRILCISAGPRPSSLPSKEFRILLPSCQVRAACKMPQKPSFRRFCHQFCPAYSIKLLCGQLFRCTYLIRLKPNGGMSPSGALPSLTQCPLEKPRIQSIYFATMNPLNVIAIVCALWLQKRNIISSVRCGSWSARIICQTEAEAMSC